MTKIVALLALTAAILSAPLAANALTNEGLRKACQNNTITLNGSWDCR